MQNTTNILVVDDNQDNLRVVGNFLKEKGYKIALALDGESALKVLENTEIDLILLDIMMPIMDGFEVCQLLKANDKTKDIPVIFLTAKFETDDIVKGFEAGGVDYVSKPFKKEELYSRIKTHLELFHSRRMIKKQSAEIEKAHRKILNNLNYARNIQKIMLPEEGISYNFGESMLVYQPQNLLSGDFYWTSKIGHKTAIVLADCTGHGVSASLIAIMAITLLNQMPKTDELLPSKVLDYMRNNVKVAFKQVSLESPVTDGLDMAFLIIDPKAKSLAFAGANIGIHLWQAQKAEFLSIEPDYMPISVYRNETPFTDHQIALSQDDQLFLFTDGLTDMFDSTGKHKFSTHKLMAFLKTIIENNLEVQKEYIEAEIANWIDNKPLTDDLTLLSLKINLQTTNI